MGCCSVDGVQSTAVIAHRGDTTADIGMRAVHQITGKAPKAAWKDLSHYGAFIIGGKELLDDWGFVPKVPDAPFGNGKGWALPTPSGLVTVDLGNKTYHNVLLKHIRSDDIVCVHIIRYCNMS